MAVSDPKADFFTHGGGSLTAAQLVARIRTRHPQVSVNDVYLHPTAAVARDPAGRAGRDQDRASRRGADAAPRRARAGPAHGPDAGAGRPALGERRRGDLDGRRRRGSVGAPGLDADSAVVVARPGLAGAVQPGRADRDRRGGARLLLRGVRPGSYPRGGSVHVRLWAATRLAELSGATGVSGASWTTRYARALGAKIGNDVDLHSAPPVTGLLKIGRGAAVEPEVDLGGYWVDGDVVHIGKIRIGAGATIGSRSTLLPGARIGKGSEIAAGSTVPAPSPPVSAGRARPRGAPARPACPGRRPARCARARGRSPTASRRCCSGCCPRWRRCRRSRSSRSGSPARRRPRKRRAGRC